MSTHGKYIFGTMSLGRNPADPAADLRVVAAALEAGVRFHSSRTYERGFSFMVLQMAFAAHRGSKPEMILKIRDASPALMRFEVEDSLARLGMEQIHLAQLVSMDAEPGNLVDQLCRGEGALVAELAALKARGLIREAVIYVHRGNADAAVAAARHPLIDGLTGYWSPVQRDLTETAWAALQAQEIPFFALRTLGGWRDPALQGRREALQAQFPGRDPVQLALDWAASFPVVRGTIGGTANLEHLQHFLTAASRAVPLSQAEMEWVEAGLRT